MATGDWKPQPGQVWSDALGWHWRVGDYPVDYSAVELPPDDPELEKLFANSVPVNRHKE